MSVRQHIYIQWLIWKTPIARALPIPQATGKTMKSRRALEMAANIAPADMGHMKVCSVVPTHRNFQAPVGGRGGEGGILLPGHIRTSQSPFCPRACC